MPSIRYQITRKISVINATKNSLLALIKIITGYLGNSHSLIADGIHSFSDLLTDAFIFFAAKAGAGIPDKEHPYGHQRIETVATIVVAVILIVAAGTLCYHTLTHILKLQPVPTPNISVIIVAIISILANEGLYHYTLNIGKKVHSNLLVSSAWHNRSDAFVSIIVLVSVIGTYFGFQYLDSIGAFIIALLILKIGIQMIWSSLSELIDTGVDENQWLKIHDCIQQVPGVVSIHQLRTRLHGGNIFVDVHIIVNPLISVSEGHHIGDRVHLNLMNQFPNISDVVVHIDPEDDSKSRPSLHLPSRQEIDAMLKECCCDLPGYQQINKMNFHYLNGELTIEIFIPHSIAANKEKELKKAYCERIKKISQIKDIVIHFTPD